MKYCTQWTGAPRDCRKCNGASLIEGGEGQGCKTQGRREAQASGWIVWVMWEIERRPETSTKPRGHQEGGGNAESK